VRPGSVGPRLTQRNPARFLGLGTQNNQGSWGTRGFNVNFSPRDLILLHVMVRSRAVF
jgi:hypothetical protein